MALNVTLSFPDSAGAGPISGIVVHRYQLRDALSELFELTLQIASTDPALDLHAVVGETLVVHFTDEPGDGQPTVAGLVRGVRQLSSGATSGAAQSASNYEIDVVPPLWLATRRRDHRIFEHKSAIGIVQEIVQGYDGRIPAPIVRAKAPPEREYVVQYGETDHDFMARILADEGITWFFDHESQGAWTLLDDTTTETTRAGADTLFIAQTDLLTPVPHVFNVTVAARIETSASHTRDFNYENVKAPLDADGELPRAGAGRGDVDGLFQKEAKLEAYVFEVGKYTTEPAGKKRATDLLEALRARGRTYTMEANFTRGPGARIKLAGHPRNDCNGEFVVVRARIIEDDGAAPAGDPVTNLHLLECVPLGAPFLPVPWPKPRIHASQTAFVVGGDDGEIVSDTMGRVKVQFTWDRKSTATRFVRVSQAWAGSRLGFFALPRVGDEVVVTYLDGDPDQPLVVGRVHDNLRQTPINPTGETRTISTWKSQSLNKPSGFNEVLMDDATDKERLELHAEKDYKRTVEHDSRIFVKHDDFLTVDYNKTDWIKRAYSMTAGSITLSTGPYLLTATTVKQLAKEFVYIKAGDYIMLECGASSIQIFPGNILIKSPMIEVDGGSHLLMHAGKIDLNP
jgi:type VI secretion system secreted protein VgrG